MIKQCIWAGKNDAQNQRQGMASFHEQLVECSSKIGNIRERGNQNATGRNSWPEGALQENRAGKRQNGPKMAKCP